MYYAILIAMSLGQLLFALQPEARAQMRVLERSSMKLVKTKWAVTSVTFNKMLQLYCSCGFRLVNSNNYTTGSLCTDVYIDPACSLLLVFIR